MDYFKCYIINKLEFGLFGVTTFVTFTPSFYYSLILYVLFEIVLNSLIWNEVRGHSSPLPPDLLKYFWRYKKEKHCSANTKAFLQPWCKTKVRCFYFCFWFNLIFYAGLDFTTFLLHQISWDQKPFWQTYKTDLKILIQYVLDNSILSFSRNSHNGNKDP